MRTASSHEGVASQSPARLFGRAGDGEDLEAGQGNGRGMGAAGNGNGNGNGHAAAQHAPAWDALASRARVSVIVPTLNEARNLPYVLPRIPPWVDEVVLVDGGSTDGTVRMAKALLPHVLVVGQDRPGKGAALQAGFHASRGDIIVTLDADGSADPAELPAFVGCLIAGADFVKGSRFLQGGGTDDMGFVRRSGNWWLRLAVRVAFGGRYSDLCYGYNAFWRRALPALDGEADGFEIETFMNVRALAAGLKVAEVPSYEACRIHGVSNLSTWRDGFRVLRTIVRERVRTRGRRRLESGSPVVAALPPGPPVPTEAPADATP